MYDDALKCFSYLKENAPKWLAELRSLERHVEKKQEEMAKMPPVRPGAPIRNGSVASVREYVVHDYVNGSATSPSQAPAQQPKSRKPSLLTKRKKNPGSITSTVGSGPPKFRSRSMVIVYYDDEIQKAFEKLVRDIGNGRNLIRKGKMAARMAALESQLEEENLEDLADGEDPPSFALSNFRRAGERNGAGSTGDVGGSAGLERADKSLEKAQGFCERGAHQFLRDGDCRSEIEGAKGAFEEVLQISTEELPRLDAAAKAATPKPRPRVTKTALRVDEPYEAQHSTGLMLGAIEVDEDEEQNPVALPTLRLTSRMGPRRGPG